jgi:hypothetical protein
MKARACFRGTGSLPRTIGTTRCPYRTRFRNSCHICLGAVAGNPQVREGVARAELKVEPSAPRLSDALTFAPAGGDPPTLAQEAALSTCSS